MQVTETQAEMLERLTKLANGDFALVDEALRRADAVGIARGLPPQLWRVELYISARTSPDSGVES